MKLPGGRRPLQLKKKKSRKQGGRHQRSVSTGWLNSTGRGRNITWYAIDVCAMCLRGCLFSRCHYGSISKIHICYIYKQCTCVGMCTWVQVSQEPEMSDPPRVGVIRGCKPPGVDTRNWTQDLWGSGTCSFLLSHAISPGPQNIYCDQIQGIKGAWVTSFRLSTC